MSRHDISDEKWAIIEPMLTKASVETRGKKRKDDRLMLNGILWILKTGAPWRDLHPEFGPWKTVHNRLLQWAKLAIRDDILKKLSINADPELTYNRCLVCKAAPTRFRLKRGHFKQDIGRSKGGLTTKIHAVVNALGNPLRILLTPGHVNNIVPVVGLI